MITPTTYDMRTTFAAPGLKETESEAIDSSMFLKPNLLITPL